MLDASLGEVWFGQVRPAGTQQTEERQLVPDSFKNGKKSFQWWHLLVVLITTYFMNILTCSKLAVRDRICKLFGALESIPPAYVARRTDTATLFLLGTKPPKIVLKIQQRNRLQGFVSAS
jgi:hypothetical protein